MADDTTTTRTTASATRTTSTSENTSGITSLTSIFTIPTSGCDTAVLTEYAYTSSLTSCAPPGYSDNVRNWGYYSPGICPSGYTSGCQPWNESRSRRSTESWAACVPISYRCDTTQSFRYAISVSGTSTISRPFIAIRWASSDLSILETNPTAPSITTRPTASGSSTTRSSTTRSPTQTGDGDGNGGGGGSPGLSGGAIAGIVIGALAAIALIALGAFFIYRHRKKRLSATPTTPPAMAYTVPPGAPGGPGAPPGAPYYQQQGQQPYPSPGPYPPGQHPQGMYLQPGMQGVQQPPMAYQPSSPGATDPSGRPYSMMTSVSGTTATGPPGSMYNSAAGGNGYEAPKYAGWTQGGAPPAEMPHERPAEPPVEMPAAPVQQVQEAGGQPVQGQQYQAYSPPAAQGAPVSTQGGSSPTTAPVSAQGTSPATAPVQPSPQAAQR